MYLLRPRKVLMTFPWNFYCTDYLKFIPLYGGNLELGNTKIRNLNALKWFKQSITIFAIEGTLIFMLHLSTFYFVLVLVLFFFLIPWIRYVIGLGHDNLFPNAVVHSVGDMQIRQRPRNVIKNLRPIMVLLLVTKLP